MIAITVNGKNCELPQNTRLPKYLASIDINVKNIAVAINGTVLRREELDQVTLSEGDRLEIVRAVGGG